MDRTEYFAYFVWLVMPVVLFCATGVYLSSVACRVARWRHWRVSWHWGLLGAAGSAVLSAAFVWVGLAFQPGEVYPKVFETCSQLLWGLGIRAFCFATVPALVTVWYYRRKFRRESHVA